MLFCAVLKIIAKYKYLLFFWRFYHKKMVRHCAIEGCTGREQLYQFPQPSSDEKRFLDWVAAAGDNTMLNLCVSKFKNKFMCNLHFEKKYILNKKLSRTAVPTLKLQTPMNMANYKVIGDKIVALNDDHDYNKGNDVVTNANVLTNADVDIAGQRMAIDEDFENDNRCNWNLLTDINGDGNSQEPVPCTSLMDDSINEPVLSIVAKQSGSGEIIKNLHINKQKVSILHELGLQKKRLTTMERELYNEVIRLRKSMQRVRRRNLNMRDRLKEAESVLNNNISSKSGNLSIILENFINCHVRNASRHIFTRKYTLEDKIFALSLWKRSPSCYRYMTQIFCLPSVKTLEKFIKNVPLMPGLNNSIFENIKCIVKGFRPVDKYCILMFDEMKLDSYVLYSVPKDMVYGYVDFGFERKPEFADHVLVWMLRGINKSNQWKLPVVYTFCKGTSPWEHITFMYKEIVKTAYDAGLYVVASVCDQGATNVRALNNMLDDTTRNFRQTGDENFDNIIFVGEHKVIPLFDPPHLLKAFRNNLLTKDLTYKMNKEKCLAKWSHIEVAYFIDQTSGVFRTMPKLTEFHVVPEKIKKQKVSKCTQVFSKTVASVIELMSFNNAKSKCGSKQMPREAIHTAKLLMFLNNLFDSLNTDSICTTETCAQVELWNECITVLESMYFIKRKCMDRPRPPVLKNLIRTIKGFKLLRIYLRDLGFTDFEGRMFNQDPLENFFGVIRQYGGRNTNPNCTHFESYYKSLFMSNISVNISKKCNCTMDSSTFITDVRAFLTHELPFSSSYASWELPELPDNFSFFTPSMGITTLNLNNYIRRHVISKIADCSTCLENLMDNNGNLNSYFEQCLVRISNIIFYYLPIVSHRINFADKIFSKILDIVDFHFVRCEHYQNIASYIVHNFCLYCIQNYFKLISNILNGSQKPPQDADVLMMKAYREK